MDGSRGGAGSEIEAELRKQTTPQICLSPPVCGPLFRQAWLRVGTCGRTCFGVLRSILKGGLPGAATRVTSTSPSQLTATRLSGLRCHVPPSLAALLLQTPESSAQSLLWSLHTHYTSRGRKSGDLVFLGSPLSRDGRMR